MQSFKISRLTLIKPVRLVGTPFIDQTIIAICAQSRLPSVDEVIVRNTKQLLVHLSDLITTNPAELLSGVEVDTTSIAKVVYQTDVMVNLPFVPGATAMTGLKASQYCDALLIDTPTAKPYNESSVNYSEPDSLMIGSVNLVVSYEQPVTIDFATGNIYRNEVTELIHFDAEVISCLCN